MPGCARAALVLSLSLDAAAAGGGAKGGPPEAKAEPPEAKAEPKMLVPPPDWGEAAAERSTPPSREEMAALARILELLRTADPRDAARAEDLMDRAIKGMRSLGFPEGVVRKRVLLRIRFSYGAGRYPQARAAALAWLRERPDDLDARDALATNATALGIYREAYENLKAISEADPSNRMRLLRLLRVVRILRYEEEARALAGRVLEVAADDADALRLAADALAEFGERGEVEAAAAALERLAPGDPFAAYARGLAAFRGRDFERAIEALDRISRDFARWESARLHLGMALAARRRFDEAARAFLAALEEDPYDAKILFQLGRVLMRKRKRKEGALVLKIQKQVDADWVLRTEAKDLRAGGHLFRAARVLDELDEKRGAFRARQERLEALRAGFPERREPALLLARHYLLTYQARRAESVYEALAVQGGEGGEAVRIAECLLAQGRAEEVETRFLAGGLEGSVEKAIAFLLGVFLADVEGDRERARAALERARGGPWGWKAEAALARIELEEGRAAEARRRLASLPQVLRERDATVGLLGALCLVRAGEVEAAREKAEAALGRGGAPAALAARVRAELAMARGDPGADALEARAVACRDTLRSIAREAIDANRKGWPGAAVHLVRISKAYGAIGERDEAIRTAAIAVEADPRDADAVLQLASLLDDPGDVFRRLALLRRLERLRPGAPEIAPARAEALALLGLAPAGEGGAKGTAGGARS